MLPYQPAMLFLLVKPVGCRTCHLFLLLFHSRGHVNRARVMETDTVLVPGASGGVGGALVQLAKRRKAKVIALASTEKHEDVLSLGADKVLPRSPENLRTNLIGEKINVVADVVGGNLWKDLIDIIERGGRYVCSGAIAGPIVGLDTLFIFAI